MKLHFMPITIVTTTIIIVVVAVAIVVVVIIIIRDNRFTLLLVRFAVLMVVEK